MTTMRGITLEESLQGSLVSGKAYGSGICCYSLHLTYTPLEYKVSSREKAALRERQNNQQLDLDDGTSMVMRKRQKC